MKALLRTLIATSIITTATAFAEEVKTETKPDAVKAAAAVTTSNAPGTTYLICKNKSIVRTIRIQKKESGCSTTYTKEGVDKIVAESQWGKGCEKVLNNIRENLEKASWKCKDISDARVSFTND